MRLANLGLLDVLDQDKVLLVWGELKKSTITIKTPN